MPLNALRCLDLTWTTCSFLTRTSVVCHSVMSTFRYLGPGHEWAVWTAPWKRSSATERRALAQRARRSGTEEIACRYSRDRMGNRAMSNRNTWPVAVYGRPSRPIHRPNAAAGARDTRPSRAAALGWGKREAHRVGALRCVLACMAMVSRSGAASSSTVPSPAPWPFSGGAIGAGIAAPSPYMLQRRTPLLLSESSTGHACPENTRK
jgi:hypothetical protein